MGRWEVLVTLFAMGQGFACVVQEMDRQYGYPLRVCDCGEVLPMKHLWRNLAPLSSPVRAFFQMTTKENYSGGRKTRSSSVLLKTRTPGIYQRSLKQTLWRVFMTASHNYNPLQLEEVRAVFTHYSLLAERSTSPEGGQLSQSVAYRQSCRASPSKRASTDTLQLWVEIQVLKVDLKTKGRITTPMYFPKGSTAEIDIQLLLL